MKDELEGLAIGLDGVVIWGEFGDIKVPKERIPELIIWLEDAVIDIKRNESGNFFRPNGREQNPIDQGLSSTAQEALSQMKNNTR